MALINLIYEQDVPAAFAQVKEAIRLNPSYPEAHLFYAWSYLYDNNVNDAVVEAQRARELDPFSVAINARLGWMLASAGRFADAERAIRFALTLDPSNDMARTELAFVYNSLNDCRQAIGRCRFDLGCRDARRVWHQRLRLRQVRPARKGAPLHRRSGRAVEEQAGLRVEDCDGVPRLGPKGQRARLARSCRRPAHSDGGWGEGTGVRANRR